MPADKPELLFLHALPLDGGMWAGQAGLLPDSTYAPTLYPFGETIEAWAAEALKLPQGDRVIVVGCSVGGSCALEVAVLAPERIAALVLIGTKADRRADPAFHAAALETLEKCAPEAAWQALWQPLFSPEADPGVVDRAKAMMLALSPQDLARGVTVFHSRPSRGHVLSVFSGPVVVVTGSDDRAPGPKTSALQADMAANGRLLVIPECGHYVPLEKPDVMNTILRAVIAGVVS